MKHSYPLALYLGFSFSSHLVVLVEVARVEEEGSSGKVSLSEKVVLVLLAIEAAAVKEGSGLLPLRRVLGRAIKACAIKACMSRQSGFGILSSRRVSSRWILGRAVKAGAGSLSSMVLK